MQCGFRWWPPLGGALVGACLFPCQNGLAQTGALDSSSTSFVSKGIEEVVVTAERRQTPISEVPFSIAAIDGARLKQERIETAQDVLNVIPGGLFQKQDRLTPTLGIRGLTSLVTSAGLDIPISMVIDDVVYPGPSDFGVSYHDVDHVEVLRGPQGTLFGRNVIGGAISVINKKPEFKQDFGISVSAGNFGYLEAQGFGNAVFIPDELAGRLSFYIADSDGSVNNQLIPGHRINNDKPIAVRGQLLWTPTDDLTATLFVDINHNRGRANPGKVIGDTPSLFPNLSPDPFTTDLSTDPDFQISLGTVGTRIDWSVGGGTLTNIAAYRYTNNHSFRDAVGAPGHGMDLNVYAKDQQYSDEMRFASDPNARLNFVVGTFVFYETSFGAYDYDIVPVPGTTEAVLLGPGPVRTRKQGNFATLSGAVFGEANFKITPQLTATAGLRYTVDRKTGVSEVTGDQNVFFAQDPTPFSAKVSKTWTAATPRVSLRYEPSSNINFYATISRGYQAGGFNSGEATLVGLSTAFNPEFATNYEIGTKLALFNHHLIINADIFRENVSDLQVDVISFVGPSGTRNAASAIVQGLEFDSDAQITDNFSLSLDYAYLDDHYEEYINGADDYSGNRFPFAPMHSVVVGGTYTQPLDSGASLTLHGDFTYHSRITTEEDGSIPKYLTAKTAWHLVNASLQYRTPSQKWALALWGKNLLNEAHATGIYETAVFYLTPDELAAGKQSYEAFYNDPRTYGVTLSYNY